MTKSKETEGRLALISNSTKLLFILPDVSRLFTTYFDQAAIKHQITFAQWWTLTHISRQDGMNQTELADSIQVGRAGAGELVERLEAKGWVRRLTDINDSRARRVYLTSSGREVINAVTISSDKVFNNVLEGISPSELATTIDSLLRMKANAASPKKRR